MGTRFSILEGKFELATKGIKFHNNEYLVLIPNFIIFDELSQMVGAANNGTLNFRLENWHLRNGCHSYGGMGGWVAEVPNLPIKS